MRCNGRERPLRHPSFPVFRFPEFLAFFHLQFHERDPPESPLSRFPTFPISRFSSSPRPLPSPFAASRLCVRNPSFPVSRFPAFPAFLAFSHFSPSSQSAPLRHARRDPLTAHGSPLTALPCPTEGEPVCRLPESRRPRPQGRGPLPWRTSRRRAGPCDSGSLAQTRAPGQEGVPPEECSGW